MNNINSIRNTVSYYDSKKQSTPAKQGINSIPAASIYKNNGMNALSSYNQASVSFEGLGFFKKLGDKVKAKKEEVVAKHQQKKEEKLQKKAEKLQAKLDKIETSESKKPQTLDAATDIKPAETPKAETPATEPAKTEAPKAEEVKTAEAPTEASSEAKKKPIKDLEIKYFPYTTQPKYIKMTDTETGTVTIDWYKESGSIAAVEEKETDGTETYTTFYDSDGKMPMESFITFPDGKHQYIKYRKNGTIKVVADLKEDNKTLISFSRYHYSEKTGKLESIRSIFEDRSAMRQWFREDGTLDCEQVEKNGKVDIIYWYFENGKNVRLSQKPLENGGLERCVYDKDGRIVLSDITKPDKKTSEEITNYYYKDEKSKNYYKTNTVYEQTKSIDTWYDEKEVATCSVFSENGKAKKAKWFFEDGETPNIQELYLDDGRKQKVTMDKDGRWTDFIEFASDGSVIKTTKYVYEIGSETLYSSITDYSDGRFEKAWYDDQENMTCRKTTVNHLPVKLEWFYQDGETPHVIRTYNPDGGYTDEFFDESGKQVKEDPSVSA